jgi:pantoate--beta-alanine ligase
MEIIDSYPRFQEFRKTLPGITLVPTMGALHAGHGSLISLAKTYSDPVVVTIFVNPKQFSPNEDFDRYPRTPDEDLEICRRLNADCVWIPRVEEIYPANENVEEISAGDLGSRLEGVSRPTHFSGVLTVVNRLFNLSHPSRAIFGKKDRQQLVLVSRFVKEQGLPVEIIGGETVREPDGLALSSRNRYLSSTDRTEALVISRSLRAGRSVAERGGSASEVLRAANQEFAHSTSINPEYCELVDEDFNLIDDGFHGPAILVTAASVGTTRLLDNVDLVIA